MWNMCVLFVSLQVSMAVCSEISTEMAKGQPPQPPPSAGSRKDKDKGRKVKDVRLQLGLDSEFY